MPYASMSAARIQRTAEAHALRQQAALAALAPAPAPGPGFIPQPGPQEIFLVSGADIGIIGGAAGGGKTFALLGESGRHLENPDFGGVIFRRTNPMIKNEGGLWDESEKMYPQLGGIPTKGNLEWNFPWGSKIRFSHLEYDANILDWYGAQIPFIGFDQLEQFTEKMWWGMISRNRSTCGVKPYIRGTCNPDADSWLAGFLEWWIDQETGYAIPERSGCIRWFVRIDETLMWADTWAELHERYPKFVTPDGVMPDGVSELRIQPNSVTFVPAYLHDNPALMKEDPAYMAKLMAQPEVERERLLGGNWKIRHSGGLIFPTGCFPIMKAAPPPSTFKGLVRAWDCASTEDGGDFSAGVLMAKYVEPSGFAEVKYYVLDCQAGHWSTSQRSKVMKMTADLDRQMYGGRVQIVIEEEGGSSGKDSSRAHISLLTGHIVSAERATGSKLVRAREYSSQAQVNNVILIEGEWNKLFMSQHHAFPSETVNDDIPDAASRAFNKLNQKKQFALG